LQNRQAESPLQEPCHLLAEAVNSSDAKPWKKDGISDKPQSQVGGEILIKTMCKLWQNLTFDANQNKYKIKKTTK
jgi:hypothetical protein